MRDEMISNEREALHVSNMDAYGQGELTYVAR